jgi:hypothetical protein
MYSENFFYFKLFFNNGKVISTQLQNNKNNDLFMTYVNQSKYQYSARSRVLKRMGLTYTEYLNSEQWKKIKKRLKSEKKFQACYCCGFNRFIDLHHKSYTKLYSNKIHHHRDKIVPLCRFCHTRVHTMSVEQNFGLGQAVRKLKKVIHTHPLQNK